MDINKFALLRFLFCIVLTVNPVKGDLDWKVYKKINHFGQELILFCMVKNCCSKSAGWIQHNEPIFLNVANLKYNDTNKYDGRLGQEGFFLFIRNFTMQDIDIEYSCSYGFQVSEQKVLNSSSVIREILPTTAPFSKGTTECTMPVHVYVVLLIMGLFILMLALFHVPCIRRKISGKKDSEYVKYSKRRLQRLPDSAECKKDSEYVKYSKRRLQQLPDSAESYYSCRACPPSPRLCYNRDDDN